ncbi:MAG TPA: beta-ketoacyl-ACP synthase III [Anaerolineales bacterium]|nr:beta-ketoacyl-ACP synthase III [Anaerolineales bacterium]
MANSRNGVKRYAHICGWGISVPERALTNRELARMVDTSEEWIVGRTGISQRFIANGHETTASLGTAAAREALDIADVAPDDVDLIIVATSTPEHNFPSTASLVQDALGARNAGAFDLAAACTGFVYALSIASQVIQAGAMNTVLVIGAETLSKIVNWEDRGTCVLFGDGAGAFVLQGSDSPGGVLASVLRSDGSGSDLLKVPAGGSAMPASYETLRDNLHTIHMNGREVFRFATRVMADACREVVAAAGLTMDDVDIIVPHQANKRIIEAAARGLRLPTDRFVINLDRYGNTSTASIPIALSEAVSEGRVRPNDNLVLVAFGGGLTWGATVVTWDVTPKAPVTGLRKMRRQALYSLARMRSVVRRGARAIEGAIWGAEAPDGIEPPHREED